MLEVVEFLHDIDQIGESALQRITNIVVRHLSSPPSMFCHKASRFLISHDEFLRSLHNFDRRNRDIFLEGLESYLSSILSSTPGNDEPGMDKEFHQQHHQLHQHHHIAAQPLLHHVLPNRRPDCFMDAAAAKSSNEILSALRKTDEATVVANLADVITTVIGSQTDDNEDLAEADQICNNADDSYATEDDLAAGGGSIEEHGAVGGLALSALPDLAKVTATPTRNQMDVSVETFLSF